MTNVQPVEEKTVQVILELQRRGNLVFCLTSRGDAIQQATIAQLQSIGLNFNQSHFENKGFKIKEATGQGLYQGVIFCSGSHKGQCLEKVFDYLNWRPQSLCFVDDKKSNVEKVLETSKALQIPCKGIRYGHLDEEIKKLDASIVQKQLEFLNNTLLSDDEAHILVKAKTQKKCGVYFKETKKEHKPIAVLWGIGHDTYETIMGLSPDMKGTRSTPKFLNVNGHMALCFRFKLSYELLAKHLATLKAQNLLTKQEVKELEDQLSIKLKDNNPAPLLHQFQHKQDQTGAVKGSEGVLLSEKKPIRAKYSKLS